MIRNDFLQQVKKLEKFENALYERLINTLLEADTKQMKKISDYAEELVFFGVKQMKHKCHCKELGILICPVHGPETTKATDEEMNNYYENTKGDEQ